MLDADLLEWTLAQRPTEDFVHQLLEVRRIVEPEACAICAVRGSDTDLARIERAYRDMDTAGMDREAFSEPDLRFHRAILTATGNDFLIAFGATVEAALRLRRLRPEIPARHARACPITGRCSTNSGARNAERARRAMHELINLTERNIVSALSRRNAGPQCA